MSDVLQFLCPACRTLLRIRGQRLPGGTLSCPECAARLHVTVARDESGQPLVTAQLEAETESATTGAASDFSSQPSKRPSGSRKSAIPATLPRIVQPLAISAVAGLGIGLGAVFFLRGATPDAKLPETAASQEPDSDHRADAPRAAEQEQRSPQKRSEVDRLQQRMSDLGAWIEDFHHDEGELPPSSFGEEDWGETAPWSWQSKFVADRFTPDNLAPDWQQPWNAAANEPFIRRSIPSLLNPLVAKTATEHRFPATHFVGVAGLGVDGPHVPVTHPHAGAFGFDRRTTWDDFRDGRANSMLIAGVHERLGPWGAGGPGTIRPFTREPYVNGPDGFGTGQTDEMLVLMADGSVRPIRRETDPRIIRRMVAIADGYNLDPGTPGDPLEMPIPEFVETAPDIAADAKPPAGEDAPSEEPIEALLADSDLDDSNLDDSDPPPPPDVEASLSVRLVDFTQKEPIAVGELLYVFEEMAGFSFEYRFADDAARKQALGQQITLTAENLSLRDLIERAARAADLSISISPTAVTIGPESSDPQRIE